MIFAICRAFLGGLYFLAILMLLVALNVFQILLLPLNFFYFPFFYKINSKLAYFWWNLCVLGFEWIQGLDVKICGDFLPEKEKALLIVNHASAMDIPALFFLGKQKKTLGYLKWFLKDSLKWVPGIGWGMLFLNNIFVKKNWEKDKKSITKTFLKLKNYSVPFWLICFAEGTRLTPEKLLKSQEFCRKNGRPIMHKVLAPRTKGVIATLCGLKERLHAVYDVTIFYENQTDLKSFILGYCRKVCIKVVRYEIAFFEDKNENDLDLWIWELFLKKDELLKKHS